MDQLELTTTIEGQLILIPGIFYVNSSMGREGQDIDIVREERI